MLIPARRVTQALTAEFARLMPLIADSGTEASSAQAIAHALALLRAREAGGGATIAAMAEALAGRVGEIRVLLGPEADAIGRSLDNAVAAARAASDIADRESAWRSVLTAAEDLLALSIDAKLTAAERACLCASLTEPESADIRTDLAVADQDDDAPSFNITAASLEEYLRDRFDEPRLTVTSFLPLAGGFGKQTTIFAVDGKALSGELVMRRDMGANAALANDCHLIAREYPVIKAAHARGFPAPEALWLDTDHRLLPGGDFLVMRKSSGVLGGNFFGAQTAIPDDLAEALADIAARLHALPPLIELGDLASFIRTDLWQLDRREAVTRYIREWYDFYRSEVHTPSPALTAIYGWLLHNVPERRGRPSLIHGDIGFHNFLFDGGKLNAVLDWEFAHIGDPAEELGYIAVTVGGALDWPRFMARYVAAGGETVDESTLRFFKIWAFARNASGANILSARFDSGAVDDLKLTILPHHHFANFISAAEALIASPAH